MLRPAVTLLLIALGGSRAMAAPRIVVHNGESIQAAIDAAPPGARFVVKPGVYRESGATRALTITKDGISLEAASRQDRPVIIQQSGTQTHGVWVSPADSTAPADAELPPCGVSNQRLQGFRLTGFTVEGFGGFGVYLACVDDFAIRHNRAVGDLTYSIFPVRSSHGRMAANFASGTRDDACIYVGQDETMSVHDNTATDCIIGYEIENSHHVRMFRNVSTGNTAGMLIDIVGNRQVTTISENVVRGNVIEDNNRPNTASPENDTSQIPPGIGLILEGADQTLIKRNMITNNGFAGMTLVNPCLAAPDFCAPPIDFDPHPDLNHVIRNTFAGNNIDVIYLPGGGEGNCFAKNKPAALSAVGGPLPGCRTDMP